MNLSTFAFFAPGPWELLIIGGIVLLLFGSRLPTAMRSLGRSVVEFKKGIKDDAPESGTEDNEKAAAGENKDA